MAARASGQGNLSQACPPNANTPRLGVTFVLCGRSNCQNPCTHGMLIMLVNRFVAVHASHLAHLVKFVKLLYPSQRVRPGTPRPMVGWPPPGTTAVKGSQNAPQARADYLKLWRREGVAIVPW